MAIYLDHASTTPIDSEIAELIADTLRQPWANPASQHAAGRRARAALEDAKDRIKESFLKTSATSYQLWQAWQLVLTSGGTEANNLALHGLCSEQTPIYVGATEHPSILSPAQLSPGLAARTKLIPIDPVTLAPNIDVLEQWLAQAAAANTPALVSVMACNNETGLSSDLYRISKICHQYGAILHTDAVQAAVGMDLKDLTSLVDALTVSGHKLNGPVGVGALFVRSSIPLRPMLFGGGQQLELRPGTESVSLGLAMAMAVEKADQFRRSGGDRRLAQLREQFELTLESRLPWIRIIGQRLPRFPHISSVAFPGFDRQALLMKFDLAGLQCSSGSACASGSSQPSHVLTAMNLPTDWVQGTIRLSFGKATTHDEVMQAIEIICSAFP